MPLGSLGAARHPGSTLERMRVPRLVAASILLFAAAFAPAEPPSGASADRSIRIYDRAGTGTGIVDLLAPFMARLGFGEVAPRTLRASGLPEVTYRRANGDIAVARAGRDCVLLELYATRTPTETARLGPADRSSAFETELKTFLDSLPTPRPTIFEPPAWAALKGPGKPYYWVPCGGAF